MTSDPQMNIRLVTFETIDSTNAEALRQARDGADEGLCVMAYEQTAGRGRQGRTWVSEKDAGLYFSIVLRPSFESRSFPLITLMAGVAVYESLRQLGIEADIKWVNDLLVNEKKICGILAETAETPGGLAVVVGIGINLTSANFRPEIAALATSIEEVIGAAVTPAEAADLVARYLSHFYSVLAGPDGGSQILGDWEKRSSYFRGKQVRVITGSETVTGTTDGLEQNGALRIARPDGSVTIIQAGDVEQLRASRAV